MYGRRHEKGFTLLELSISMLFVSLLSIAVVLVINNVISAYQRGTVLSRLDNIGSSLVEDMRNSVQDAISGTRLRDKVSIVKTTSSMIIDGINQGEVPIFGIFCSGSYTYFWNSGYFFTSDATFDEKQDGWAKIKLSEDTFYNPNKPFRLVKVQDTERAICISLLNQYADENLNLDTSLLSNTIDISILNKSGDNLPIEIITLLQNDNDNDLALYNLTVKVPAANSNESISLYDVAFTLGTTTGGVEITPEGSTCAAPIGDVNWSNSCAASEFSFVTQSNTADIGAIEQVFLGNIPEAPEIEKPPEYTITYFNNCQNRTVMPYIEKNNGTILSIEQLTSISNFGCPDTTFGGWNTSTNGDGTPYSAGELPGTDKEKNLTLYAIWNQKSFYKVTYHVNVPGYTDTWTSSRIEQGHSYTIEEQIWGRRGYVFDGWNEKPDGSGKMYYRGNQITINSNIDLYSIWSLDKNGTISSDVSLYETDRVLNTITLIPENAMISPPKKNGVTEKNTDDHDYPYYGIGITGQSDGEDIGILRIYENLNFSNTEDICETFNSYNECDTLFNDYTATIYKLFKNGTKQAVLYLEIANPKTAVTESNKSNYVFYASEAFNPFAAENGTEKYYRNIPGHVGEPIGLTNYPLAWRFQTLKDDLLATSYLPTRIYGKDATIEGDSPKYWIIAKIKYTCGDLQNNPNNYKLTITPINKFTNTDPNSFAN